MSAKCCICRRELGDRFIEGHHLVPKSYGGKEVVAVHKICHQKIHATFSERELAYYFNTPEILRRHSQIDKFVKWVKKKPLDFYDKNDDTKERKRRRR